MICVMITTSILMPQVAFASGARTRSEDFSADQFDDSSYTGISNIQVTNNANFGQLLTKALGVILNIVRIVALGWGIVMLIAIAMKYMSGSAQVKAQLKTDIPTYVVGAVLLFGGAGIITLIQFFMNDNFSTN
ncbi:MAG: hypothetical protein IJ867_05510 [Clostridia bacterium]|nr:hypothetical protein [Clostridia bacterium]